MCLLQSHNAEGEVINVCVHASIQEPNCRSVLCGCGRASRWVGGRALRKCVGVLACVRVCVCACARVCVHAWLSSCMGSCVHFCMRAPIQGQHELLSQSVLVCTTHVRGHLARNHASSQRPTEHAEWSAALASILPGSCVTCTGGAIVTHSTSIKTTTVIDQEPKNPAAQFFGLRRYDRLKSLADAVRSSAARDFACGWGVCVPIKMKGRVAVSHEGAQSFQGRH